MEEIQMRADTLDGSSPQICTHYMKVRDFPHKIKNKMNPSMPKGWCLLASCMVHPVPSATLLAAG
eukprot:scaffold182616_cov54-Attheya_sp.AAC.5